MKPRLFLLPVAAVLAGTAFAKAETASSELLLKLIRDNGCQMTHAEAQEILPKHGYTPEKTRDIVSDWQAKGWVGATPLGNIVLSDRGCKG